MKRRGWQGGGCRLTEGGVGSRKKMVAMATPVA